MAKSKPTGLPKFDAPPPPPAPKSEKKTHDQTLGEVLTAIRQHPPEQQNWIIGEVLRETAFSRHDEMMAIKEDLLRSEANFKEFMNLQSAGEQALNQKASPVGR
jgi:hypothetical protein